MHFLLKSKDFPKSLIFVLFFFVSFFLCFTLVSADTNIGVINADQVNFRSGPGTNSTVYQQLNSGLVVTVKSTQSSPTA